MGRAAFHEGDNVTSGLLITFGSMNGMRSTRWRVFAATTASMSIAALLAAIAALSPTAGASPAQTAVGKPVTIGCPSPDAGDGRAFRIKVTKWCGLGGPRG